MKRHITEKDKEGYMMKHNIKLCISAAGSRKSTTWNNQELYWSEFVEKLKTPARSTETLQQYLSYNKGTQDDLKDVGGFVGGRLSQNRRKNENVVNRSLITLDMDNIPSEGTTSILQRLGSQNFAYAVYSTRKHEAIKPRLRIIMLLDQPCLVDEYEPITRKLASMIGIEYCDPTTFEASRLMYWPSCCADSQYEFHYADRQFVNKDGVLNLYSDWHNVSEWPTVSSETKICARRAKKQGNPREKKGIVGAFCKTYSIETAMTTFLADRYSQTDIEDRYTFVEGSTTGGAIIYNDGDFLFSHHATDPCSGKLVNAFDLVRLHKYSGLDFESKDSTPSASLPSFKAMREFAIAIPAVVELLNQERYERAVVDFSSVDLNKEDDSCKSLMKRLQVDSYGNPAKTIDNVLLILELDPCIKDRFFFDEFANYVVVNDYLPWDDKEACIKPPRRWDDESGLRWYLEKFHGLKGGNYIDHALDMAFKKNRRNKVKDYLIDLAWDGVKRLDTLLIDYFGAEDNLYTRNAVRKSLIAAVARAMVPGTKYDTMLILVGAQGIGKSTFFKKLGKEDWYSDSLTTFEGKEAAELVQGYWIIEVGELAGFNKSELRAIKQFLSRTEDIYREAYGRRTNSFPRRCVFFGTTHEDDFLRDRTGNRRFWPIDLGVSLPSKNVFNELDEEVDQIWAEAYTAWQLGERLYLDKEAELISQDAQEDHKERNPKEGMVLNFIAKQIPIDWTKRDLNNRRMYWDSVERGGEPGEIMCRKRICALEIWCECFNFNPSLIQNKDTREINHILDGIKWLEKSKKTQRFGKIYGVQKGYIVKES